MVCAEKFVGYCVTVSRFQLNHGSNIGGCSALVLYSIPSRALVSGRKGTQLVLDYCRGQQIPQISISFDLPATATFSDLDDVMCDVVLSRLHLHLHKLRSKAVSLRDCLPIECPQSPRACLRFGCRPPALGCPSRSRLVAYHGPSRLAKPISLAF